MIIRPTGHSWSVNYVEAEVDELVAQLQTIQPIVAIVEATGGLELSLVAALAAALHHKLVAVDELRFGEAQQVLRVDRRSRF